MQKGQVARQRSQGAQDFYLAEIFNRIGTTNKFFVEWGFNEPSYTSGGSGANTWKLWEEGWRGLLLDANNNNPDINLHAHYLFAHNIVGLFKQYQVPNQPDLVSCDMDSHDFFVLAAVLAGGYRPRVILTEYNSNYPLNMTIAQADPEVLGVPMQDYKFKFQGCAWGVSASAWKLLADRYGYTIVGRVSVLDLVWIRTDLVRTGWQVPNLSWLFSMKADITPQLESLHHFQVQDPAVVDTLVDVKAWMEGKDVAKSRWSARAQILSANLRCFAAVKDKLKARQSTAAGQAAEGSGG